MKKIMILLTLLFLNTTVAISQEQDDGSIFKYFFKPRPVDNTLANQAHWDLKPIVQIPAIKLTESTRQDAEIDATFLASAGGGISLQHTIQKDGKNYSEYGASLIVLLSGDTSTKGAVLDISAGITIGFLNNLIQLGTGRDFGSVGNRSRWFGLLSFGINLTNN